MQPLFMEYITSVTSGPSSPCYPPPSSLLSMVLTALILLNAPARKVMLTTFCLQHSEGSPVHGSDSSTSLPRTISKNPQSTRSCLPQQQPHSLPHSQCGAEEGGSVCVLCAHGHKKSTEAYPCRWHVPFLMPYVLRPFLVLGFMAVVPGVHFSLHFAMTSL